ncbi:polysaccharide lyase family 8 protein [Cutaneotrichosporon oleaginosum]|uniref:Polysaccharide lyase family 8 protein n=1 Tax=Cutaneotrichosporon oleaginosum TaxID=879819 RepID=A0A0J0XDK1_9TREE|nr:polysaccharide lyase family 8 protein [Cutaneotrichosporon oleaginosum]KLT39175.1 polysaccharide lyase family 8 protein [Cutaneotrichosporon oleaginosum]TXT05307.1 hypothetical protein COLE_06627 [Cutaneotrichosporon oleaginosum]
MLLTRLLAASAALSSLVKAQTKSDVDLILERRRIDMASFTTPAVMANVSMWLESQSDEGIWADVDYSLGCAARRANWPIQLHWIRVIALASAWSGLNPSAPVEYHGNEAFLAGALKGMDWWFARDYTNPGCTAEGGKPRPCPCGTPGTWNQNWFGNVILIPQLLSTGCLLVMPATLTDLQREKCFSIPNRAWELRDLNNPTFGVLTGANMVNVMQNSISMALFANNVTIVEEAFSRAMGSYLFADAPAQDGTHRDGSFLQHDGILYNGNYGKDALNAFIQLEGEAIGTAFAANDTVREAVATFIRGSEWMIYADQSTRRLHWDFNTIGRFLAFHTSDLQASADINFNTSRLATAVADFTGANDLSSTVRRLQSNGSKPLTGNHAFYAADYMVHRRNNYVLANKMISSRSINTEYVNSANPYGFLLGQGTLFSYVTGNEYKDIQAGWDWHLIPGTTSILRAAPLRSDRVEFMGKLSYVGVVSNGEFGAGAMDYLDPADGSLAFRKAWFFFEDSVLVTTTSVVVNRTAAASDAPVITTLDQRTAADGTHVAVDGNAVDIQDQRNITGSTLLYAGNGYLSHGTPFNLTLSAGARTGNWSAISTSAAGVKTVDIFSAYTTVPSTAYSYEFFPDTNAHRLRRERRRPTTTPLDLGGVIGAASGRNHLALIFWPGAPLTATVPHRRWDLEVTVDTPVAVLFTTGRRRRIGRVLMVTVSDPSQAHTGVRITVRSAARRLRCGEGTCTETDRGVVLDLVLPTGGLGGSSVSVDIPYR